MTNTNTAVERYDYGKNAGQGFEGTSQSDFTIPFLGLLQSGSKVITENILPDARPGMLLNTATMELIDGKAGIVIVPVRREHAYVEWVPRAASGGSSAPVAHHDETSEVVKAARAATGGRVGKMTLPNGNELIETFYVYALVIPSADASTVSEAIVIAFSSTKIKRYKQFMTLLRKDPKIPLFANRLRLTSIVEKNAKGTFYNVQLLPVNGTVGASLLAPDSPIIAAAIELRGSVESGAAKADFDSQAKAEAAGVDPDEPF